MHQPDIRVFADREEMSRAAAVRFVESARVALEQGRFFAVALSGGSTPRRLYELLAGPPYSRQISWQNVHVFQVDERCVTPDDAESNFRMIREVLLSRAPIPAPNVHQMRAEEPDLEAAARGYADELARVLKPGHGECPRLDLVFLGMGPDGHTASLFPGSAALGEHSRWVAPNYVERLGKHRLTLTLPVLNAASELVFLVSGAEKAETLGRVLRGPAGTEELPAQRIRPARGLVRWFLDRDAGRFLEERVGQAND